MKNHQEIKSLNTRSINITLPQMQAAALDASLMDVSQAEEAREEEDQVEEDDEEEEEDLSTATAEGEEEEEEKSFHLSPEEEEAQTAMLDMQQYRDDIYAYLREFEVS